jgi:type VI secretion system protein ImpM
MDGDAAPGWFGKISSLGDFAHRRLPPAWLQACDAWLSQALRTSQAALGDRWLDVYLTSPMQRFAWAPGVIDDSWWFGLFMPSCDSVGRYFPLLIAQSRDGAPQDRVAFDQLERWYDHLVAAAMRTLDERGTPVEALEEALHESVAWTFSTSANTGILGDVSPGHHVLAPPASLSRWLPALASTVLLDTLAGCSLWWPVGAQDEPGALRLVRGLPWNEDFVDLLESR